MKNDGEIEDTLYKEQTNYQRFGGTVLVPAVYSGANSRMYDHDRMFTEAWEVGLNREMLTIR